MNKFNYTKEEIKLFRRLNSPQKLQDYINKIPFNFEEAEGTCISPRKVIRENKADCVEGALFAAAVLEFHGKKPLVIDLRSVKKPYDYDHVVAVFSADGYFGAVSKTNHPVLRYRDPIYKTIRELVMSFFHEYFLKTGQKTLREYSDLFDLNYFNNLEWRTTEKELGKILTKLDKIKHYSILTKKQIKNLRKADEIQIESNETVEYSNNG